MAISFSRDTWDARFATITAAPYTAPIVSSGYANYGIPRNYYTTTGTITNYGDICAATIMTPGYSPTATNTIQTFLNIDATQFKKEESEPEITDEEVLSLLIGEDLDEAI